MTDQVLKVSQVAKRLGLSTMTVYRLIHADKLNAVRVSERSYRIYESALAAYLRERNGGLAQPGASDGGDEQQGAGASGQV
jgi:excisionase family DNA binding protein